MKSSLYSNSNNKLLIVFLSVIIITLLVLLLLLCNSNTNGDGDVNVLWARKYPQNVPPLETAAYVLSHKILVNPHDNSSLVCGSFRGDTVSLGNRITVHGTNRSLSAFVLVLDANGIEQYAVTVQSTGDGYCAGLALVSECSAFYFAGVFDGELIGEFFLHSRQQQEQQEQEQPSSSTTGRTTTRSFLVQFHMNGTMVPGSLLVLGSSIDQNQTQITDISSDLDDNLYVVGHFNGQVSFYTGNRSGDDDDETNTTVVLDTMNDGSIRSFLAKYNTTNDTFSHVVEFGGEGTESRTVVQGISTNVLDGTSCIIGYSTGDTMIGNITYHSQQNRATVFMQQVNTNGTQVWFDKIISDRLSAVARGVHISGDGSCSFAATQLSNTSPTDNISFFTKYDASGQSTVFEICHGCQYNDLACQEIYRDNDNDDDDDDTSESSYCYIIGQYYDYMRIGDTNTFASSMNDSSSQYFVAVYDAKGTFVQLITSQGTSNGQSLHVCGSGGSDNGDVSAFLWVTGEFSGGDLTIGDLRLVSVSQVDTFVIKYLVSPLSSPSPSPSTGTGTGTGTGTSE